MGKPVPIVQLLVDGSYKLNEEELASVVSTADGCQRVAVISIIGSEGPEKRFVLSCLANYLNSDNKDEWPHITQTVNNCGSVEDTEDRPLVYLWSKPFILRDDDQNTAVFLMDANLVFSAQNENSNTGLTDDIIALFCGTSSTLIYLKRGQFNELIAFKNSVKKTLNKSFDSFEELIYLVIDWNTKYNKCFFGVKGGQQFMKGYKVNLDQFFTQTKCYLLPPIGAVLNEKDLVFDKNDKTFVNELLKLIENKLLIIDEMNVKKGEDSQYIEPNGLVELFRQSVQQMNESFEMRNNLRQPLSRNSSQSIDKEDRNPFPLHSEQESGHSSDIANNVIENAVTHRMASNIQYNNNNKHNSNELTHQKINSTSNPGFINQLGGYYNRFKRMLNKSRVSMVDYKSVKDKLTDNYKNQMETNILENKFSSIQEFHKQLEESSLENELYNRFEIECKITDGFTDNYRKTRNEMEVKLKQIKEELFQVYNFCQQFESSLNESVEKYHKRMQSLIESAIDKQMANIFEFKLNEWELKQFHYKSKDKIFEAINYNHGLDEEKADNLTKHFQRKFINNLLKLLVNYRQTIKALKQYLEEYRNMALNEGVVTDEDIQRIIERKSHLLNDCNPLFKTFSLNLFEKTFPEIKRRVENKLFEIKQNYETIFKESVKQYERGMRHNIQKKLDGYLDWNLKDIHDYISDETHSYFRVEVNKCQNSNALTIEFDLSLSKQLSSKKSKFQTALDQINQNRDNWIHLSNTVRYLSEEEIINLNQQLMDKFISFGDEELDSIVKKQFVKHFNEFMTKMDQIDESETKITEELIEKVIQLFEIEFNCQLMSGFFTKIEANAMFEKLLNYTLKSVLKRCDFNEYQNHLIEFIEKQLDIKLRTYLKKAFAKHSQNSVNAKELKKQRIDSSAELYANEMKRTISSGIRRKDYHKINDEIKSKSMNNVSEQIQKISKELDYFNDEFYENWLIECQKQIIKKIDLKSEEFFELFDKNAPKETSIAIYFGRFDLYSIGYEEEVANTSNNIDVTPNCIAFDNKIMVGTEALNYYKKLDYDNFDIKAFLGQSSPATHLSNSMPFQMTDKNKVKVKIDSQIQELSVESLIALQVLDIKTNAENQTQSSVKSAVFTIPTHFDIKQRNAMKDVANIAGIESVEILTEITAAAIALANDTHRPNRESETHILIVAMNDNKCDSAVCKISQKQIVFKTHFQYELSDEEVDVIQNSITEKTSKDRYNKVKNIFEILTEDVSHKTNSFSVLIIGSSDVIPEFKFYIQNSDHYKKKEMEIYECDPINIIVKGSSIYGNPFYRNHFVITEATLYPIGYMIRTQFSIEKFLMNQNTSIPTNTSYSIPAPKNLSYYPILIEFYQKIDDYPQRVEAYKLNAQVKDSRQIFNQKLADVPNYSHNIIIGLKDTGLPFVESVILPNDGQCLVSINISAIRVGLSLEDMMKEKEFIQTYWFGSTIKEQPSISSAEPLLEEKAVDPQLERSKQELKTLYLKVKVRIEKCDEMSPLLRENYEQKLMETLAVIQSKDSNRDEIDENKQMLEKIMQKTERFIK